MSTYGAGVPRRRSVGLSRALTGRNDSWFVPLSALAVVAIGAWLGVQLTNPDAPIATSLAAVGAGGFALLVGLVLTVPMAMFTTAFALLGFVLIEPAPVDVVFFLMIMLTVAARVVDPLVPGAITVLLVLLVALTLLSIVNAADTATSIRFEAITLFLVALGVWLTWMFRDPRATRLAMTAYVLAASVTAGLSTVARFAPFPGGEVLQFDEFRVQGLFQDPNVFAAFLVPAAAIVLEDIARPRLFPWSRNVSMVLFMTFVAGTIVAFSRAGWLNLFLACTTVILVTTFRRGGMRRMTRVAGVIVATAVGGIVLLSTTGSLAFLQQRTGLESYDSDRFGAQSSAFSSMTDFVLGHGPGQVEEGLDISTHSMYARSAYEQGVLGLVLVSTLMLVTLGFAWGLARRDADVNGVGSAALLGSWLGLLASGFFIDTLHWRHLWVVAALIWVGAASRGLRAPAAVAEAPG
jgi:hypothetical protein